MPLGNTSRGSIARSACLAQPDLPVLRAGLRGRFAERLDLGDAVEPGERIDAAFSADQHASRNRRLGAGDGAVEDLAALRDQEQAVAEPLGVLHDVRREQHGRSAPGEIADQLFEHLLVDRGRGPRRARRARRTRARARWRRAPAPSGPCPSKASGSWYPRTRRDRSARAVRAARRFAALRESPFSEAK